MSLTMAFEAFALGDYLVQFDGETIEPIHTEEPQFSFTSGNFLSVPKLPDGRPDPTVTVSSTVQNNSSVLPLQNTVYINPTSPYTGPLEYQINTWPVQTITVPFTQQSGVTISGSWDLNQEIIHVFPDGTVLTDHWLRVGMRYIFAAAYRVAVDALPVCACGCDEYELVTGHEITEMIDVERCGYYRTMFIQEFSEIHLPLLQCDDCDTFYYHLFLMA